MRTNRAVGIAAAVRSMLSCKGEKNPWGGEEERVMYRALVVEDDEDLRELLAEVLSMHDYAGVPDDLAALDGDFELHS